VLLAQASEARGGLSLPAGAEADVAKIAKERDGGGYLQEQKVQAELSGVNRELRRLKTQIAALEKRKSELEAQRGRS
jgi:hypothetical protein